MTYDAMLEHAQSELHSVLNIHFSCILRLDRNIRPMNFFAKYYSAESFGEGKFVAKTIKKIVLKHFFYM